MDKRAMVLGLGALVLSTVGTTAGASVVTATLHPEQQAAGSLTDTDRSGTTDEASSGGAELQVGDAGEGQPLRKAVFEFQLPQVEEDEVIVITSATFRLWGNGTASEPASYGTPPSLDLFSYHGPEANGTVELADDEIGINRGQFIASDTPLVADGANMPEGSVAYQEMDLTEAVQQATDGAANGYVGFRLEMSDSTLDDPTNSRWRFRGTGFTYNEPQYYPALMLEYEIIPEPGTMGLLGLGGVVLLARRRQPRAA